MEFDVKVKCAYYFNEIAKIPHGSYNEKRLSDYIVDFAIARNLDYKQDSMGNVIVYKPASGGYEDSEPLLIQAHMDMVCEANKGTDHNFREDSLDLYVEDGWLYARGTTLGADDGTGVAYMLSILDDNDLSHPKLECVFTVQEEVGLNGASHFDSGLIEAKRMICLDGGGEYSTCISSAGGIVATSTFEADVVDNDKQTYSLSVSGLSGGHSGGEIHKEKGNANKIAVRIIKEMMLKGIDINIVSINGGLKDNAIPRESEIVFVSDNDFMSVFNCTYAAIKKELEFCDDGFHAEITECDVAEKCFDSDESRRLIDYLYVLPNGFMARSMAIEGLTVLSLNLGIINSVDNKVIMISSIRSALNSGKNNMVNQIKTLASAYKMDIKTGAAYPGWNYCPVSKLREKLNEILLRMRNKELVCEATHGGNECGVFNSYGVEDIITYGPITQNVHTPDERLNVDSFIRSYEVLIELIKECK